MERKLGRNVSEFAALIIGLLVLIPFYMLLVNSLKDQTQASLMGLSLPSAIHFDNFATVIREAKIGNAFKNSLIITIVSVTLLVVFSAMAGYVIQRKKSKTTELINLIIVFGLVIPQFIVPTYILAKKLHLTGGLEAMILVCVALNFPVGVFLYSGFFKTIPREIDESALLDGCGPYTLFFRIIYPLLTPVTVTNIVIQFLAVWNDFSTSVYFLNSQSKYNLVMTTFLFFGAHSANWNLVFADLVLVSLPVLVVYVFLQKYVISGLTSGAVKS